VTVTAEVKLLLDQVDALTAVYRTGWVPDDARFPYASILDPVSEVPALRGDARTLGRRRLIQVDLWTEESLAVDSDALVDAALSVLDGAGLTGGGRLYVQNVVLVPDEVAALVVHYAFTLSTART
jgi:hypothetical protein